MFTTRASSSVGRAIAGTLLLAAGFAARADEPGALYLFPAGGQRGTTVPVRVGGLCLHAGAPWEVLGEGVQASERIALTDTTWFEGPVIPLPDSQAAEVYPRDYLGEISLAADAPPGVRHVRVWNAQGAAPALRFVVGELPEIVEQEQDGAPLSVPVELPVTINGRTFPREDVDLWSFQATAGETICCEVLAARIGSPLDSHLAVLDAQGRVLAENGDALGLDSLLVFRAPAAGEYLVRIGDSNRGGLQTHVYRLTLTRGLRATAVFPLGGQQGTTQACEALLSDGTTTAFNVLFEPQANWGGCVAVSGRLLDCDTLSSLRETEPNDTLGEPLGNTESFVGEGRIAAAGDVDRWPLAVRAGENLHLEVRAGKLGSPLDAVLVLRDAAGLEVARNDDVSADDSDSALTFTAPADGVFVAEVSERFADRGGPEFGYRLRVVRNPAADFQLRLAAESLTLLRGGEAKLRVDVLRQGGFNDAIELNAADLPPGVTVENTTLAAGAAQTELLFRAAADAPIAAVHVRIAGVALAGEQRVERAATRQFARGEPPLTDVLLSVALSTPFKIVGTYELQFAPRGSVQQRRYRIERTGYDGPLVVRLADRQARHLQGVTGPEIAVPAGATEFDYPVYLPPWMELGRTSRTVVTASAVVPDGQGGEHEVCFTSPAQNEQIVLLVSPGKLAVTLEPPSVICPAEGEVVVRAVVERGPGVTGPVRVELVLPAHVRGVKCAPVELAADATQCDLVLHCEAGAGPWNAPCIVRASTLEPAPRLTAEAPLEAGR